MLMCPKCGSVTFIDYDNLIDLNMEWGTYGKNAIEQYAKNKKPLPPLKFVKLVDCSTDHLEAILEKCKPTYQVRCIIIHILQQRKDFERKILGDNE